MDAIQRTMEKVERMEQALETVHAKARDMSELPLIANAMLEAATMPSEAAMRTIMRALAFRLLELNERRIDILDIAENGMAEPEAEEGESLG